MNRRFGYLVPQYPGQTHIMFWRELEQLRALGMDPRPVTTRSPARALQAHAWAAGETAATPRLVPRGTAELLRAGRGVLRAGPSRWLRVIRTALRSERPWRDRPSLAAAVLMGARLNEVARRDGWDHVHVHSCASSADVARMAYLLGGPTYSLTLHGPLGDYGPDQQGKWGHARFGLVITERLREELADRVGDALPDRVVVSGMGVDLGRFTRPAPYRPWSAERDGPARVFSCGRLNPAKGHADLVTAVYLARRRGLPVQLEIAGEDEAGGDGYRQALSRLVADLGLQDCVRLSGALPEESVVAALIGAHVFALASLEEPLGVAIMEAMAAGVPTIATRAGGVPELISHGQDGLLVPPRQPRVLADALARVLLDQRLAADLGGAARRRAEERATRPTSAEHLVDLLAHTGVWASTRAPGSAASRSRGAPVAEQTALPTALQMETT